jgi:GTP cyclohydrolase I
MAPDPPSHDRAAAERAIASLIRALGLDPEREPELRETPARVAAMYAEIFSGLPPTPEPELATFPRPDSDGEDLVLIRDMPFHSLCIHHFVPFFGRAHVAYLPGRTLVGISGIARVLEHWARRPQLQERLGAQVADHLQRALAPRGVAVLIEARHLCMEMRGVRKPGVVSTRTLRGALAEPAWISALPASAGEAGDPHAP